MTITELKAKANNLPLKPGVYIMKDKNGTVIYVGKAKALKNRVTQYFGAGNQHTAKVHKMVSCVNDFEYIICDSEFEALILENSLIKQHQPKYNILLKDDKGSFYIKITNDKWKKIQSVKQLDKDGEFIGPYNSGFIVSQTVDEVRKIFRLPSCNRSFDKPTKPCLDYHIGLCDAPCRANISVVDYNKTVLSAVEYIKNGDITENSIAALTKQMEDAAENLNFELAARLRDRINAINKIKQKQKVVEISYKEQDVFGSVIFDGTACVAVLKFRNFKLWDKQHFFIGEVSEKSDFYAEFLQQYYVGKTDIPSRVLIDCELEETELLETWLSEISGKKISIILPKQGEQKRIIEMCQSNAVQNLSEKTEKTTREMSVLNELKELLNLEKVPRVIEAYDISNMSGDNNVAGMIVFKDAKPYKTGYKRFKIKGFLGQDDYRSMAEVLDRRFSEYQKGENPDFAVLPDLILLDGAKGQIGAVLPVMEKYGINVALFGMVKDSKHRTRAIATTGGDIVIKSNRRVFTFITNIQDEVHRFAISYQKQLQSKKMLGRELTNIKGIGDKKANALLKHFGSITKIKNADIQSLVAVKGINEQNAVDIVEYFNNL
ncbi:MAG: excinuclease ABC subunit UvrC [Clostridia bacterium]|nr:excinuclease ABC subunit UvrC [Clostridia bacterium]